MSKLKPISGADAHNNPVENTLEQSVNEVHQRVFREEKGLLDGQHAILLEKYPSEEQQKDFLREVVSYRTESKGEVIHYAGLDPEFYVEYATKGKCKNPQIYLSEADTQNECKLTIDRGVLRFASGELYDTPSEIGCMFVIDSEKNIYVLQKNRFNKGKKGQYPTMDPGINIKHSCFFLPASKKQVLCVGWLKAEKGKICAITDNSGHYKPKPWHLQQGADILKGAFAKNCEIQLVTNFDPNDPEYELAYNSEEFLAMTLGRLEKLEKERQAIAKKYKEKQNVASELNELGQGEPFDLDLDAIFGKGEESALDALLPPPVLSPVKGIKSRKRLEEHKTPEKGKENSPSSSLAQIELKSPSSGQKRSRNSAVKKGGLFGQEDSLLPSLPSLTDDLSAPFFSSIPGDPEAQGNSLTSSPTKPESLAPQAPLKFRSRVGRRSHLLPNQPSSIERDMASLSPSFFNPLFKFEKRKDYPFRDRRNDFVVLVARPRSATPGYQASPDEGGQGDGRVSPPVGESDSPYFAIPNEVQENPLFTSPKKRKSEVSQRGDSLGLSSLSLPLSPVTPLSPVKLDKEGNDPFSSLAQLQSATPLRERASTLRKGWKARVSTGAAAEGRERP